jgi:hypothetical protein
MRIGFAFLSVFALTVSFGLRPGSQALADTVIKLGQINPVIAMGCASSM